MTSEAETFCRDKRLFDVRRGVVYLRRTDNLAQRQWRHYGTVPAIKTHVIRDIGVTTRLPDVTAAQYDADQSLTDTRDSESEIRDFVSDVRASASEEISLDQPRSLSKNKNFVYKTTVLEDFSTLQHPQISLTEVTDRIPTASPAAVPPEIPKPASPEQKSAGRPSSDDHVDASLPNSTSQDNIYASCTDSGVLSSWSGMLPSLPPITEPASTSKQDQYTFRELYPLSEDRNGPDQFNTWGSRDWAVDSKLEPDLYPKSHAPKHYPPMSRAAGAGLGKNGAGRRQLKTLTDFRSRNGTVRIIQPLPPVMDSKKNPVPSSRDQEDDLDLDNLQREQTYAMLKRIDRLLEPTRAYFTSDLASSQRELRCSTPSTSDLTESVLDYDEDITNRQHPVQRDQVQVHDKNFQKYFGDLHENTGASNGQIDDSYTDRQQIYTNYIQDRLRQFYGNTLHLHDRSRGRSYRFRGHSEPPHGRLDRFPGSSDEQNHGTSYDQTRGAYNLHESSVVRNGYVPQHQSPVMRHSKLSEEHGENYSEQSRRCHNHSRNTQANRSRRNDARVDEGTGKRGKGWGTLREVIEKLEKKGVDLHLKCHNWIIANFS